MRTPHALSLVFAVSMLAACTETTSEGTVDVTVYGEDFIEKGIPAEEMTDGWAVTFDRFVVTVDEVVRHRARRALGFGHQGRRDQELRLGVRRGGPLHRV